jgi:hypothetical protein
MGNPVIEHRLRASRPEAADVGDDAFDAELLARIQRLPIERRRPTGHRVVLPVAAAGVTLAAASVVMFAGGPGDLGGPSSAVAIEQALRWFSPPDGTVLHVRSVETQDGRTMTHESWQDADTPSATREVLDGPIPYEIAPDGLYDPTSDTIYLDPEPARKHDPLNAIVGDPVVRKVRYGLQERAMTVIGRGPHDGHDAWEIALKPDAGRPVWKIWVSAENGKPLELRDPGRDASEAPSTIRWDTYEVLDDRDAAGRVTLAGAHPGATVIRDRAQVEAAFERALGPMGRHKR